MPESSTRYLIPARRHLVEEVIQKSRFITIGAHAPDPEAAHAFVDAVRREYPDATHHCWAFVAGQPGSTASIGMSDDGEPHGTAGRPMLHALLHGEVGEIVAVCVRYYGGTKLGTGGLTRAYAGGIKLLLEGLPTQERVDRISFQVVVEYSALEPLQRFLQDADGQVLEEDFGEQVTLHLALPGERAQDLVQTVAELTRGRGVVRAPPAS